MTEIDKLKQAFEEATAAHRAARHAYHEGLKATAEFQPGDEVDVRFHQRTWTPAIVRGARVRYDVVVYAVSVRLKSGKYSDHTRDLHSHNPIRKQEQGGA